MPLSQLSTPFGVAQCRWLEIVPGATHLFEEPGTLEQVERRAADWFRRYLPRGSGRKGSVDVLDGVAPGE